MKKITFVLFALIAGTTFAQSTASAEATVNATVVSPISISKVSNLEFGRVIGSTNGGVVTVSNAGVRTDNASNALLAPSNGVQAASFTVKASADHSYKISIPSIDLTGGSGDDMTVNFTSSLGNAEISDTDETVAGSYLNVSGTGADQTLTVGGALTVNSGQGEGSYSGTATVTVAYE